MKPSPEPASATLNRYGQIIESVFLSRYTKGTRELLFEREDIERAAAELKIRLPKNIGDVIYSISVSNEPAKVGTNQGPKRDAVDHPARRAVSLQIRCHQRALNYSHITACGNQGP